MMRGGTALCGATARAQPDLRADRGAVACNRHRRQRTIFAIANALLLQAPAGVADPGRFVDTFHTDEGDRVSEPVSSYASYLELRQRVTTLEGLFAYQLELQPMSLAGAAGAELVHGTIVTSNYFAMTSTDPNLPIVSVQRLDQPAGPIQLQLRIATSVSGSLRFVGLLLAAIGIYGVTAYAVTCRTREIGIRVAMGATRADIIGMVMRQGIQLVALGGAAGMLLAAAASRLLTRLLFGVPPTDPATFAGAAALVALIGLLACWIPARRATQVDPVVALRRE